MNKLKKTFSFISYFQDIRDVSLLPNKDIQLRVNNTGNEVICVYTTKPLKIDFTYFNSTLESNPNYNYVISPANIINNACKDVCVMLSNNIKKRKARPVIVSLGVQANLNDMNPKEYANNLFPEIKECLNVMSERSISIGVRGEFTYDVLKAVGIKNVDIIGCPSWFVNGYNQPIIEKKEWSKKLKPVCYTCWQTDDIWTRSWNKQIIFEALKLNDPKFVIQSEFDLLPYYFLNSNLRTFCQNYSFADLKLALKILKKVYGLNHIECIINKKIRKLFEVFLDIDKWEELMKTRDFAYGMRIHGSVVAIKQGIPAITVVPDSRILEMSEFFKIPYIRVDQMDSKNFNIQKIYEEADFSEMNKIYPQLLENYITFLNKNGIKHKFVKQENNKEELINK